MVRWDMYFPLQENIETYFPQTKLQLIREKIAKVQSEYYVHDLWPMDVDIPSQDKSRVLFTGDNNIGKTTYMKQKAAQWARGEWTEYDTVIYIPIDIMMRDDEYWATQWLQKLFNINYDEAHYFLKHTDHDRTLWILDHMDHAFHIGHVADVSRNLDYGYPYIKHVWFVGKHKAWIYIFDDVTCIIRGIDTNVVKKLLPHQNDWISMCKNPTILKAALKANSISDIINEFAPVGSTRRTSLQKLGIVCPNEKECSIYDMIDDTMDLDDWYEGFESSTLLNFKCGLRCIGSWVSPLIWKQLQDEYLDKN